MELRIRATGVVMYEQEWRQWLLENGGPSFGVLTPEIMEELGVDPVFEGQQATLIPPYQVSVRDGVEQRIDGKWYKKYKAGPVFVDNAEATAAEQEAAYKAQMDARQAAAVRTSRNAMLRDSDWTQLADFPGQNRAAWVQYRKDLRDVPQQPGFPWTVTWPVAP